MKWDRKYYDNLWDRTWRRGDRFADVSSKIEPRQAFPDPRYLRIGEARSITATVLFVDIVSFTKRSEDQDSKSLLLTLDLFLAEMTAIVNEWGGTVEKFTGDGLMAVFDTSYTDEAGMVKDAIDAATTMRYVITGPVNSYLESEGIQSIEYRIGIDGGAILIGKLGVRSDNDPIAIGWAANIASKLEDIAPVDGILIGNYVYSRLPDWEKQFCVQAEFPAEWIYCVKGTNIPYPFYRYTAMWNIPS